MKTKNFLFYNYLFRLYCNVNEPFITNVFFIITITIDSRVILQECYNLKNLRHVSVNVLIVFNENINLVRNILKHNVTLYHKAMKHKMHNKTSL